MARMSSMSAKPMVFRLNAPQAKRVSVAGNFNNWNMRSHPAKKDLSGNWSVKLNLRPGRYEYKFFVDGQWVTDPNCKTYVPNSYGTQNCVVEVK
jgi:1,4-alpha-glucan branching enzyme